jgi:hypothetical protein
MFVLKLQLLKLNDHKYGFENSYVKTAIEIPALETENRYTKFLRTCLRCTGCSLARDQLAAVCPSTRPICAHTQSAMSG